MKSIISMSFGFGLLISHTFGSAADLMGGVVGEAQATASFFEREVNSAVAKIEQALVALKLHIQGGVDTITCYQQASTLNHLVDHTKDLERLLPLFVQSNAQAEKIRLMLDAMPKDSDEESAEE